MPLDSTANATRLEAPPRQRQGCFKCSGPHIFCSSPDSAHLCQRPPFININQPDGLARMLTTTSHHHSCRQSSTRPRTLWWLVYILV